MKVIILAGGFGTRLSEYTEAIPKPMVTIGDRPVLWHIMKTYSRFGHKDFFLALGYKAEIIKDYFFNYRSLNSDFTVDLTTGVIEPHRIDEIDWKVTLINTGLETMTGGRIKRLKSFIGDETFMLTYGDSVADVNIDDLVEFHNSHGKLVTLTAVRPPARFGALKLKGQRVSYFKEKSRLDEGWINGGFFVIEPEFFKFIKNDSTYLEREPLEKLTRKKQLAAFRHEGFWQCMDTKRDKDKLDKILNSKKKFNFDF